MTLSDKSVGDTLRDEREAKGFSIEEVSSQLKLNISVIKSLESNEHEALPATAFVRGYLRGYAQLLKLDVQELVDRYNGDAAPDPELALSVNTSSGSQNTSRTAFWPLLIVMIILFVLLGAWAFNEFNGFKFFRTAVNTQASTPLSTQPPVLSAEDSSAQILSIQEVGAQNPVNVGQAADASEQTDLQNAIVVEDVTDDITESAQTTDGEQSLKVDKHLDVAIEERDVKSELVIADIQADAKLLIEMLGESWVEITDANGIRLTYNMYDDSYKPLNLKGKAPFRVILGDSSNVSIQYNGEKFDQSKYNKANNTAHFYIGTQE